MFLVEGSFCFRFGCFQGWFIGASFCGLPQNGFFALLVFLGHHPIAMALPHPWQDHWCKAHSLIGFHSWAGSFCFLLKGLFVLGLDFFQGWFVGASFCVLPNKGFFALLIFLGYHHIAMSLAPTRAAPLVPKWHDPTLLGWEVHVSDWRVFLF